MTWFQRLLETIERSTFSNLGHIYLWPGHFIKLTPLEYLGCLVAGSLWVLLAGWVAWRQLGSGRQSEVCRLARAATVLFVMTGAYVTLVYPPTTDEPHYLQITESLAADGDLELAANYASGSHRRFYPAHGIDPHTVVTPKGEMYSQHTVGLPVLILPLYALGGRWGCMLGLAALATGLLAVLYALCRMTGASSRSALISCGLLGASSPLLFASTLVFTEVAAAGLTGLALYRIRSGLTVATCAAVLPWLHPRFCLLSAGLMLVQLYQGGFRQHLGTWLVAAAVSGGLFFRVYQGPALLAVFNTLTEQYPAKLETLTAHALAGQSFGNPLVGLLGKLFDRNFGLIPFAPWMLVLLPGIMASRSARCVPHSWFWLGGASYMLLTLLFRNWGGSAFPGRTLVPLLPFAAPYLALGVEWTLARKWPRRIWYALAAVSIIIGYVLTVCTVLRYESGRDWIAAKLGWLWLAMPMNWFPSFQ